MKNKIKVMYLATTSKLYGAEKIIFELSKRMNKEQFEIMVCTIKDDLKEGLLEGLRKIGIRTACLGMDKKWKFYRAWQLFRLIKQFKPDILQSFLFFDNILARIFGQLAGVPIIISGQRNVEFKRTFFRYLADKYTLFLTDLIISNTERGKDWLVEKFRLDQEKIKVIYNGVEIKEEPTSLGKREFLREIGLSGDEKIVGFIGRLEKQKGVQFLIEAMRILNSQDSSIYALIIGEGREQDKLEKYAGSFPGNIIFLGWKNQASQYLKVFDILVLPSLWEGMPNVILEAMGKRIPVIATRVGGNMEIIEDGKTGFLLEPGNSQQLAKKIKDVLSLSKSERQGITIKAKNKVINNFNLPRMVKQFEDTYLTLLSGKPL